MVHRRAGQSHGPWTVALALSWSIALGLSIWSLLNLGRDTDTDWCLSYSAVRVGGV